MRSGDTDGVGCEIDRQIDRVTGLDEDCFSDIPESYILRMGERYVRGEATVGINIYNLIVAAIEYDITDAYENILGNGYRIGSDKAAADSGFSRVQAIKRYVALPTRRTCGETRKCQDEEKIFQKFIHEGYNISGYFLYVFWISMKRSGWLVVMKSTPWSIHHFMPASSSTVHTLTFMPRSWICFIHSGCFWRIQMP